MSKKSLIFFTLFILCLHNGAAEFTCLSEIFLLGRGIKDLDGDKLVEKISLQIIIPDTPSAYELSIAADIAARVNLESLVVDFSILKKESEVKNWQTLKNPILIGTNLSWIKELEREKKINLSKLKHNQGIVTLFTHKNQRGVAPMQAISLALIFTTYQPMFSKVKVMGSVFTTRYFSPKSKTAASSPIFGPTITLRP